MRGAIGVLLASFALPSIVAAQATPDGASGDGVIFVGAPLTSLITFKSDDASVKFSFLRRHSATAWYWGFDITGKTASAGLGSLVKTNDVSPGTKLGFNLGKSDILTDRKRDADIDWLYAQLQYDVSQTVLYDGSRGFDSQIRRDYSKALSGRVGYSYVYKGAALIGVTTGVARRDNYKDLPEVEVALESPGLPDSSGKTRVERSNRTVAKTGNYLQNYVWNVHAQAVFIPEVFQSRYGLSVYENTDASSATALRKTDIGFGFHILKPKSPAISLGALIVEATDVLDAGKKGSSLGRRLTISLQGSVPLAAR
jgi:hypothetical protein